MIGVSFAPEMHNKIIQQTLDECDGVQSIFDDLVVHGKTTEEHDKRLENVLQRLCERGLTLNANKCQFNMTHIGISWDTFCRVAKFGMTKTKVDAIVNARRPETVSEVRSFFGLVNFSGRFIPNLATTAEQLRKLTRNNVPFK